MPIQFYGRRPIYIISFTFFSIWMFACAFAQNTQTMLIARFLDGLAGSAFLSVAGGTVGDMFAKHVSGCPAHRRTLAFDIDAHAGAVRTHDGLHG
jgi:MFS family permease